MVNWRRVAIGGLVGGVMIFGIVRSIDMMLMQFGLDAGERLSNLRVYIAAAQAVLNGRDPYTVVIENGEVFTYPPFAAALFTPFALLPDTVAHWLVTGALVLAAVGVARLAPREGPVTRTGVLLLLALVLASGVFRDSLRFGQVSLFLVLAVLFDASLPDSSRWKGVLLGITAAIRLTPLAIVPFLLAGKQYKMAARAMAAFLVATLAGFAVAPGPSTAYWGELLWHTARVGDDGAWSNFALRGSLERTLGGAISTSAWIGLALIFAAGLAWLVYRRTSDQPRIDAGELVLVGGLASLVLSPITWTHHMGWVLAALPLLWARRHRLLAVASALMMALPVYALARGGYLGSWYEFGLALRMLLCVAAAAVLASGVRLPAPPRSAGSVGSPS